MTDFNLDFDGTNNLMITDEYSLFIQEVELAIKIIEGSIWNKPEGLDIQAYVFNKFISAYQMKTEIRSYIERECEHASMFPWNLDVKLVRNKDKEYLLITMIVYRTEEDALTHKFIIS